MMPYRTYVCVPELFPELRELVQSLALNRATNQGDL